MKMIISLILPILKVYITERRLRLSVLLEPILVIDHSSRVEIKFSIGKEQSVSQSCRQLRSMG